MNSILKKLSLSNHKSNCRICLNPFTAQNQAIRISYDVEKRFHEIFQTEVKKIIKFSLFLLIKVTFILVSRLTEFLKTCLQQLRPKTQRHFKFCHKY